MSTHRSSASGGPTAFTYLVVEAGDLRVVHGQPPTYKELTGLVGGGIGGVPIPFPKGKPVIGYCNNNGIAAGLGANCYVVCLRDPIPGPLVILGMEGEGHRSLTEAEVAAFSMQALPGRPLPTLCIEGLRERHDGEDPAIHDPFRPGEPMDPPEVVILPWDGG